MIMKTNLKPSFVSGLYRTREDCHKIFALREHQGKSVIVPIGNFQIQIVSPLISCVTN